MTHHPALHRRPLQIGAVLLAGLGIGTATAPAALAVVDPTASASAEVGTAANPATFGVGELLLWVGEEPGNELGGAVDLGGATIQVTFTDQADDASTPPDEIYTCTTDHDGRCVFTDDEGEYSLWAVTGDAVTVEQLSAPSSGVFTVPDPADSVVHAVVPTISAGTPPERTTPEQAPSSPTAGAPDVVDRVAPDVLSKHGSWNQVVFFDPQSIAPGNTEPDGSTAPGSPEPGATAPGTPTGAAPDVSTSTAGATTTAAPAAATTASATASAASTPTSTAPATPRPVTAQGLPTTGADVLPMLWAAGALVIAGTGGLLAARRRTTR